MITFNDGLDQLELKNPTFSNTETLKNGINARYDMTGLPYTTVKDTLYRLVYSFDYVKEIKNSVLSYFATPRDFTMTDHHGKVWTVKCVSNPIQFSNVSRTLVRFTLELEGHPNE